MREVYRTNRRHYVGGNSQRRFGGVSALVEYGLQESESAYLVNLVLYAEVTDCVECHALPQELQDTH